MIKCKNCGGLCDYKGESHCPNCHIEYTVTALEASDMMKEARLALKSRNYETVKENLHFLANRGVLDAEREYAAILEKGRIVPKDIDLASKYYLSAAKKNDGYSAYKYSRLLAKTDEKVSKFWLAFAAMIGATEAFPKAADMYRHDGDEDTATYYYAMAAACDDTHATVTMAKRYFNGIGVEPNINFAKWFMDRLTFPPIYAIRLKLALRHVEAREPNAPVFANRNAIIRRLLREAEKLGFHEARRKLARILAETSDPTALYSLGTLLAEGIGGEVESEEAVAVLEQALAAGSSDAAKYLGDMFVTGKVVEQDIQRALEYYKHATSMGYSSAYEAMGDIFREGELVPCNIAYAIELYKTGGNQGDENCRAKAMELIEQRESLYNIAIREQENNPTEAFDALSLSAAMGYLPSHSELAKFYENGIGTKVNRQAAFFWYGFAVKKGDTSALYDLGRCFARGIGTAFNFNVAMDLLTKAVRFGSVEAKEELSRLMENKTKALSRQLFSKAMRLIYQQKYKDARAILEVCNQCGHAQGSYTLGCMYEFGLGGYTDREAAKTLYETAYKGKFRDPKNDYKLKILRMTR